LATLSLIAGIRGMRRKDKLISAGVLVPDGGVRGQSKTFFQPLRTIRNAADNYKTPEIGPTAFFTSQSVFVSYSIFCFMPDTI
jgi:hypothetical protein